MRRQVFISHSSNRDPATLSDADARRRLERAIEVREAVANRLSTEFDVWLDRRRLRVGDSWRLEIFEALHRCSAAVILLDDDAFDSTWVLQEATIVNSRSKVSPGGCIVIPVLLDQGTSARFDQGLWRPLALRDEMASKASSADEVADEVALRLADLAASNVDQDLEEWVERLAGHLRKVAMSHPELLTRACEALGIERPHDWTADNASAAIRFARALISAPQGDVGTVVNRYLREAVPRQEDRESVARLLQPIWVDLTAAACTAVVLRPDPQDESAGRQLPRRRRMALNTARTDFAGDYIDRAAYCGNGVIHIRSSDVFGEDADELYHQLERLVIDRCPPIHEDSTAEDFAEWLSEDSYWRPVLFVRASLPPPQFGDLLDRLSDRFPGLALFILNDGYNDEDMAMLDAAVIRPPLDPQATGAAHRYRGKLQLFIERRT